MSKRLPSCSNCSTCELNNHHHEESFFEEYFWYFISISGIFILGSIFIEFFLDFLIFSQILAIISIILSSYEVVKETLYNIKEKRITANLLMVIAAIASFFIFHGQEGATAILLYAIAEYLEELTTEKSRDAIKELLELAPDKALVKRDGGYLKISSEEIKKGEIVGIKPAMKVPLDGIIERGESYFDESAITGESIPVFKERGDEVFAGSINSESFIDIKVLRETEDTVVAQIAKTIEHAQQNKSQKEKFIEKFARYYTPSILIAALLVMIVPTLLFNLNFVDWFYRGLILLVVSCPCALTLSTPLANIVSLTKLAKEGILVKGNRFIELVNDIETFAFDKTGTLTEGKLKVYEIISYQEDDGEILKIAASLERLSEHPISQAIVNYAKELGLDFYEVEKFEIIKGRGIKGNINDEVVYVGSEQFFQDQNFHIPESDLGEIKEKGTLPVLIGRNNTFLGIITIRDILRVSAPILINGLKKRGYTTTMISGDTQMACNTIGDCLDINNVQGNLLPNQKIEQIESIKKESRGVAMVGDGINDAPALASANLGIAIGASATDLTLETADIVIMNDNLTKLLTYIDITKKTNKIIKQNIWTSIIVKLLFAILTVLGLMTLWIAVGIGDALLSFLILFNGMRIFRYRSKYQEINTENIETNARHLICESCKLKQPIPQHHGRDMIIKGKKLICWRSYIESDFVDDCKEEIPLTCPRCDRPFQIEFKKFFYS